MIRYLRHKEIDKKKWDACIDSAVNRIVYAFSWYLDIAGPGWDALVGDDYATVFPLVHKSKSGIAYLYQPYFTQQLGVFSTQVLTGEIVTTFLAAIPEKFRFAEIHLNSSNQADPGMTGLTSRANHELDLIHPYETLNAGYSENTRRNLKKATSHQFTLRENIGPDELIALFRGNFGKKEGKLKSGDYEILRRLLGTCLKHTHSRVIGIQAPGGTLCAAAFFLEYKDRVIFHLAASDSLSRGNGAMFFLIDRYIREQAGSALTLDFEGSNDTNVARFYKGFGAREVSYPMVRFNHLPAVIRKGVYFVKRFRG
jgi:hypothetical protein